MSQKIDLKVKYTNKLAQEKYALEELLEQYKIALKERTAVYRQAVDANAAQAEMIEALKAQVEQLQNQVKIPATSDEAAAMALTGMNWLENNDKSKLTEFHNKYVAEIKARAVEDAFNYAREKCKTYLDFDFYVMEYANQLSQQVKGE